MTVENDRPGIESRRREHRSLKLPSAWDTLSVSGVPSTSVAGEPEGERKSGSVSSTYEVGIAVA